MGIGVRHANPDRPGLRLLGPESPPLPGALRGGRHPGFGAEAGTACGPPSRRCARAGTGSNDSAPENERGQQPCHCRQAGAVGEGDSEAAPPAGMAAPDGARGSGSPVRAGHYRRCVSHIRSFREHDRPPHGRRGRRAAGWNTAGHRTGAGQPRSQSSGPVDGPPAGRHGIDRRCRTGIRSCRESSPGGRAAGHSGAGRQ